MEDTDVLLRTKSAKKQLRRKSSVQVRGPLLPESARAQLQHFTWLCLSAGLIWKPEAAVVPCMQYCESTADAGFLLHTAACERHKNKGKMFSTFILFQFQ